jgi:hypothetical protein
MVQGQGDSQEEGQEEGQEMRTPPGAWVYLTDLHRGVIILSEGPPEASDGGDTRICIVLDAAGIGLE